MTSNERSDALVVSKVSKSFGGVHAVRSVDLNVKKGERVALIGPNGAGKSTLFNLVAGELRADTGQIEIFGTNVTRSSVQQRAKLGLGRTYQISELFLDLTVEENLFLAAGANSRIEFTFFRNWKNYQDKREWARDIAEQVGLEKVLPVPVKELSHGEQRQLELGMAMAMRPKLIMLDEPAAGLSASERATLTSLIKKLPRDVTLILIEHDMEIVLDIAERIYVLNRGEIIAVDTPEGIRTNKHVHEVYLGSAYA